MKTTCKQQPLILPVVLALLTLGVVSHESLAQEKVLQAKDSRGSTTGEWISNWSSTFRHRQKVDEIKLFPVNLLYRSSGSVDFSMAVPFTIQLNADRLAEFDKIDLGMIWNLYRQNNSLPGVSLQGNLLVPAPMQIDTQDDTDTNIYLALNLNSNLLRNRHARWSLSSTTSWMNGDDYGYFSLSSKAYIALARWLNLYVLLDGGINSKAKDGNFRVEAGPMIHLGRSMDLTFTAGRTLLADSNNKTLTQLGFNLQVRF